MKDDKKDCMKDCNEACTLCNAKLPTGECIFYWLIARLNSGKGERGKVHLFSILWSLHCKRYTYTWFWLIGKYIQLDQLYTIMSFSKFLLHFV